MAKKDIGVLSTEPLGLTCDENQFVGTLDYKTRTLISGSQTDYAAPITVSLLPTASGDFKLYSTKPTPLPFAQHTDIPVYLQSSDDKRRMDPKVLQYEAARNSGSYAADYQSLVMKYESRKFYHARRSAKSKSTDEDVKTGINKNKKGRTAPLSFAAFISEQYDEAVSTSNRYKELSDWVTESDPHPAVCNAVPFENVRDVCWRRKKSRMKKSKAVTKIEEVDDKVLTHRTVQIVQPRLESELTTNKAHQSNGLLLYAPPYSGKTKFLAQCKTSILQVSPLISGNKEYLATLLNAGFIVMTSDSRVLSYDLPLVAFFPGPVVPEAKDNQVIISNTGDYALDINSVLFANVIC